VDYKFIPPDIEGPVLNPEKDQLLLQLVVDAINNSSSTKGATKHFIATLNTLNKLSMSRDEITTFLSAYLIAYMVEKHGELELE